jgi:peroxiredoxin
MKWKNFACLSCLVVAGASLVQAQTRDKLRDKIKEAAGDLSAKFKELDKNGDNILTEDEAGSRIFAFLNSNGDNQVTLDEATQTIRRKGLAGLQGKATPETLERPRPESSPSQANVSANNESTNDLREGVQRLTPGEHRIGQMVPDLTLTDIHGHQFQLSEFASKSALVIAFTNTTCPVCKKYAPTLAAIEEEVSSKEVAFLFVNPTASDKREDIEQAIKTHGFRGRYVRDTDGSIAMAVGAMKTTDVFVLDPKRTLTYRGAVDDQYGFGYSTDAPQKNYLRNAIASTLANEPSTIAATSAPGCPLNLSSAPIVNETVTYHNRVSRIIQNRCLDCHRDGGVAPFSLSNYHDVSSQAGAIRQVIEKGVMPPWFAASPKDGATSPFINDCSLSKAEKLDLMAWMDGGLVEGKSNDAPLPRTFITDWQIGKPDHIIQVSKPFSVKATGTMPYQNVVVETGLTETKYVKAIEVRPTARQVVHHILVFIVPQGNKGRSNEPDEDGASGFFAAYAPGYDALQFNEGYGKVLPAGSRLKFQIHYTPNGTATEDRPMIGLQFMDEPPQHLLDVKGIAQPRLAIPPNAPNHEVVATQTLPNDATILAFFPHMHLRGKAFKYEAKLPTGETKLLLDIPRYDFNWQLSYRLADPMTLPKGTKLIATAWYDNSANNLANPDPSRTVRWGEQTYDEMMIGYIEYHMNGGSLSRGKQIAEIREKVRNGDGQVNLFDRFDSNRDGKLEPSEIPEGAKQFLDRADKDQDGSISKGEMEQLKKLRF